MATLYFSPNGDGVKDSLNFKVIAETSEPYFVAIKRNGIGVKTWPNLVGNQSLSWNGNFMFTDERQADGNYRIVAMTERQRDRVRDDQMVVLDTVGPVFTNSRIQKKNGGYSIQSAMSDKPAGIQPGTLSLAFQDAQGQEAGITGQLETENGVSPFVYNLQASAEQFNQLKTGNMQAKASVRDKAGNTAQARLNFEDEIKLTSASMQSDGNILLKGKILKDSGAFTQLTPDFMDGLEVLSPPLVTRSGNSFEILVTDYKYDETLFQEPVEGELLPEKISVDVVINGCKNNSECLDSNIREVVSSGCATSTEAAEEGSDLSSTCENREFSTQTVKIASVITKRQFIQGGSKFNKAMFLGFQMQNTSKIPVPAVYYVVDNSNRIVRRLMSQTVQPTGTGWSPKYPTIWNGTNNANQDLPEGTYTTVIRSLGKTLKATQIKIVCGGYYNLYPKELTTVRQKHIHRRHDPNFYDDGFKRILRNWVDGIFYDSHLQMYLNIDSGNAYQWAGGPKKDAGKGDLFPDNWSEGQIDNNIKQLANNFNSSDTCSVAGSRFKLNGPRDGVPLEVYVESRNKDIVTGYAPGYQNPFDYYTNPATLIKIIGRSK